MQLFDISYYIYTIGFIFFVCVVFCFLYITNKVMVSKTEISMETISFCTESEGLRFFCVQIAQSFNFFGGGRGWYSHTRHDGQR